MVAANTVRVFVVHSICKLVCCCVTQNTLPTSGLAWKLQHFVHYCVNGCVHLVSINMLYFKNTFLYTSTFRCSLKNMYLSIHLECSLPSHYEYGNQLCLPTFPPSSPSLQAPEKLSLNSPPRGDERCPGPMGSCSCSTERLLFKLAHTW